MWQLSGNAEAVADASTGATVAVAVAVALTLAEDVAVVAGADELVSGFGGPLGPGHPTPGAMIS